MSLKDDVTAAIAALQAANSQLEREEMCCMRYGVTILQISAALVKACAEAENGGAKAYNV